MDLEETVQMMLSDDYKVRFMAEYYQLLIRYTKLRTICELWDIGKLNFTPTCPREMYERQLKAMLNYMSVLSERAELEKIKL